MKAFQYNFSPKPVLKDYILSNLFLCDEKCEREILELLYKGKTCEQISAEVGYSPRTIARRRKDLYYRIKDLLC